MKKLLLIVGVLAIAGYAFKDKLKGSSATNALNPVNDDFLTKYEGKVLEDSAGNWLVISNGKVYTFSGLEGWQKYANDFPQHNQVIKVDFPAWEMYAVPQGEVLTLPGY